jgi:hypothetical protein
MKSKIGMKVRYLRLSKWAFRMRQTKRTSLRATADLGSQRISFAQTTKILCISQNAGRRGQKGK